MIFLGTASLIPLHEVIEGLNQFYCDYPKNTVSGPKRIHDCVFGSISFTVKEMSIIDLPCIQRIRFVSQTGLAKFLYPGATHSRFEHSLGTTKILKNMISSLNEKPEANERLRKYDKFDELYIAGILHDVGHTSFSHNNECFLNRIDEINKITNEKSTDPLKRNGLHEILGHLLVKNEGFMIYSGLKKIGVDHNIVADNIVGQSKDCDYKFISNLLNGTIDADRIDYLLRDAHFTGLPYGIVDVDRLVNTMDIFDYKRKPRTENMLTDKDIGEKDRQTVGVVIQEKGYHAAQALLQAKSLLVPAFYQHPFVRITEILFRRIIGKALDNGYISIVDLLTLGDYELFYKIEAETKKSTNSDAKKLRSDLINIKCRHLFKPIAYIHQFHFHDITQLFTNLLEMSVDEFKKHGVEESRLLELSNMMEEKLYNYCDKLKYGIPREDIVVDILSFNVFVESKIEIKCKNLSMPIPLIKYLNMSDSFQKTSNVSWRISIYVSPEHTYKFSEKDITNFMNSEYGINISYE